MRKYLVYLAGPITGCSYSECTNWRELVKEKVSEHIDTLSPMRGKENLARFSNPNGILDAYPETALSTYNAINARDYFDVQRSDAIFVNLLGAKKVSIGTVMEIAWARAFSKPVILVMEEDNIHRHSMLLYPCGFQVKTLEEGIEVLKAVIGPDKAL